jgi:hypothetical protein
MKRKYLSVLLALTTTIFAITGCGSDSEPSASDKTEKPSVEISESIDSTESDTSENISENVSEKETESESVTEEPTTEESVLDTSYEALMRIANLQATCETDINACYVDVTSENPYDIVWDYGEEYEKYVAACDWSLVWNYDFYVKAYPGLAALYHYDEDLLLRHFQTIGIHEGRIGSKNSWISSSVDSSENAYRYFDFMLNNDKYTEDIENGRFQLTTDTRYFMLQGANVMTALEKEILYNININRQDIGKAAGDQDYMMDLNPYTYTNDELTCLANLRAYLGAHDGYTGDDWFNENYIEYLVRAFPSENVTDSTPVKMSSLDHNGELTIDDIMTSLNPGSTEYSDCITNASLDSMGVSNIYYNPDTNNSCHIDVYSDFKSNMELIYRKYSEVSPPEHLLED